MIITRLVLYNFGVYAGRNTFEFNSSKPVVLIGGMNGRGKTTFLEAVLLALYGANSFAYSESKYHTYGQYLKAYVNTTDQTLESYVELEFKLERELDERYLVRRAWSGAGKRTKEKINVKKDGEENDFLTNNWPMFVENILPSGLSNFFFFDGEKIAELAVENTNVQMKESIKALLGISILDLLENDVSRIISKINKRSKDPMQVKELEMRRDKKNQAEAALHVVDEQISDIMSRIEKKRKSLEKIKIKYTTKGGDVVAKRQDLFNQRNRLSLKVIQEKEELINLAASELPLVMVKELLLKIQNQAKKEHETKMLGFTVRKVNAIFDNYTLNNENNIESVRGFIDYIKRKAEEESTEIIFDISDQTLYQLNRLLTTKLAEAPQRARQIQSTRIACQDKIEEIDNYLSIDIDESALAKIYKKIKLLENEIIDLEIEIEFQKGRRAALNGEVIRSSSEYNRFVDNMLSKLELNEDEDRILKYSYQVNSILDEYKIRLQRKKIGVLAQTMTNCYKLLANKKNLIDRIEMDAITLDFVYLNSEHVIVPKESLSAGEKQLMVISLLWALAICSKKKLPVIIDTPLSRMDSNHRIALITTYFPKASDQTIILSTDSEIDSYYYEIMKENVGDEFTLEYNDELKCSTISRGYFVGKNNDN